MTLSKDIGRQPLAFAAGFVIILLLGFAALAQTPSVSAAKLESLFPSYMERLRNSAIRTECCFCSDNTQNDVLYPLRTRINKALAKSQSSVNDLGDLLLIPKQSVKPRSGVPDFMVPLFPAASSLHNPESDIRVIDLDGLKKVLQRDPNDKRPLLLNFWATWCDPCREEFPDLVKLDADYKDKPLNFIAISLDDITDLNSEVPKFLTQMKATMPVVLLNVKDPEPAIKVVDATWDGQLPATFLYDKDGKVVFKHFGKIKPDELRAAIDKEIKK